MKTTLLFIALGTALLGSTPVTNDNQSTAIDWSKMIVGGTTAWKVIDFRVQDGAKPIMEISGFKTEPPPPAPVDGHLAGFQIRYPRYLHPEKPEELKIEIWTADGKKWRAKWEEVK